MRNIITGLLLSLMSTVGWGEDTVYQFSCDYPIYSNKEDAQIEQDFSFTIVVTQRQSGELEGIITGGRGASNLVVALGAGGQFQFMEGTSGGNWILTTVASLGDSNVWPSVHSRHIWMGDEFVTSQNFGSCTVR
jgi:hypothetical protein